MNSKRRKETVQMPLAENLPMLRRARHMSRDRLAQLCGATNSQIYGYENGLFNPSVDTLVRLKNALGCSFDELLEEPITVRRRRLLQAMEGEGSTTEELEELIAVNRNTLHSMLKDLRARGVHIYGRGTFDEPYTTVNPMERSIFTKLPYIPQPDETDRYTDEEARELWLRLRNDKLNGVRMLCELTLWGREKAERMIRTWEA